MIEDHVDTALHAWSELTRRWMDTKEGRDNMRLRARIARRSAVDMGPSAIDARLREMAEMSALCADLSRTARTEE